MTNYYFTVKNVPQGHCRNSGLYLQRQKNYAKMRVGGCLPRRKFDLLILKKVVSRIKCHVIAIYST